MATQSDRQHLWPCRPSRRTTEVRTGWVKGRNASSLVGEPSSESCVTSFETFRSGPGVGVNCKGCKEVKEAKMKEVKEDRRPQRELVGREPSSESGVTSFDTFRSGPGIGVNCKGSEKWRKKWKEGLKSHKGCYTSCLEGDWTYCVGLLGCHQREGSEKRIVPRVQYEAWHPLVSPKRIAPGPEGLVPSKLRPQDTRGQRIGLSTSPACCDYNNSHKQKTQNRELWNKNWRAATKRKGNWNWNCGTKVQLKLKVQILLSSIHLILSCIKYCWKGHLSTSAFWNWKQRNQSHQKRDHSWKRMLDLWSLWHIQCHLHHILPQSEEKNKCLPLSLNKRIRFPTPSGVLNANIMERNLKQIRSNNRGSQTCKNCLLRSKSCCNCSNYAGRWETKLMGSHWLLGIGTDTCPQHRRPRNRTFHSLPLSSITRWGRRASSWVFNTHKKYFLFNKKVPESPGWVGQRLYSKKFSWHCVYIFHFCP